MGHFMLDATAHADPSLQFYSANRILSLTPVETQKFQPFFDITNGSRDMGNFIVEISAHAQPPF